MLEEIFSAGPLNLIYGTIVVISFLFALLSLIGAEVGDALDFDLDADADGGLDFISISPFAMASFGSAFGITGLVARIWFEMEALPSIVWATGLGLLFGVVAQAFFIYVLSPTKSSHFSLEQDAIGREADVTVTIPEKGLGQVAFNNVSGRVNLGARSAAGGRIEAGQSVIIEKVVGRIALVRPTDEG
ncbi:MAG: NfeD family protein [Candidatus Promineifilaceae bacterium]|nr:NfeD family protein [Candidatus Promineifilaceae bacterium]